MLINNNHGTQYYLKSFFFKHLFKDIKQLHLNIVRCNFFFGELSSTTYLPRRIKKFSIVRSPTMSKLSKEQFEVVIHKVCIMYNYKRISVNQVVNNFFYSFSLKHSYLRITHLNGF
jgi:ribosomal protein S10